MVFQAAVTGGWDRCLHGGWILPSPSDLNLSLRMACIAHGLCFLLEFKLQTNLSSATGLNWTATPSSGGKEGLIQEESYYGGLFPSDL